MAYTFKYGDRPLDGVTIQRAVGRGGFGEVYYALTDSGKQVALKYLRDNADVELRGVQNVLNLKSPHLIGIHDVRKDARGDAWIVMEYISGPSLRDLLIAEPSGLGQQKSAFILQGIAKGLAYLHDRGVVHRDLKPGNIFYDDGYVKIGDYGLSKYIPVSRHSGQTMSVGTVHYMAPEIGSGKYSKAIDVYALGVILYEMLTGRLPFAGSSMGEVLMRHISDKPDLSGLPEPYASVIAKALAKNPEDRYQDATEMADAIAASGDFAASAASFDHSVLSRVQPRLESQAGGGDPARTMTTPPRRSMPALDVRDVRWPEQFDSGQNERLQRLMRKFDKRVTHWQKKFERHGVRTTPLPTTPAATGAHFGDAPAQSWRLTRAFILLIVAVAVSIALALLGDVRGNRAPEIVALSMFMVLGVLGGLFAHLWCAPRFPATAQNWVFERVLYASIGALFMLPALAPASAIRADAEGLIVGPIAAMLILNWRKLANRGRRGMTDGWSMFWAGLIGFIVTQRVGVRIDNAPLVCAGMCATIVLLTQIAAGMWPIAAKGAMKSPPLLDPNRRERDDDSDDDIGSGAGVRGEEATAPAFGANSPRGDFSVRFGESAAAPLSTPRPQPAGFGADASAIPAAVPPIIIEAPARTSGIRGVLGSAATAACILALLGTLGWCVPTTNEMHGGHLADLLKPLTVAQRFSPSVFMSLAAIGGVALILSRLGDGWMHWVRGMIAAGLTFFVTGIGCVGRAFRHVDDYFLSADVSTMLSREHLTPQVALLGALLLFSFGALIWPKSRGAAQRLAAGSSSGAAAAAGA